MLTATYTLVALSVEHANVRSNLQALQKLLHSSFIDQASLSPGQVMHAVDAVKRLVENYHWRKIDMFLVPALRTSIVHANDHANQLLRELDELGRMAAESAASALGAAAARLGSAALESQAGAAQFCTAIERFCCASLTRLDREEHDLFPLARAVISGETWFSIANKMMALDAWVQDSKPARSSAPALPQRARFEESTSDAQYDAPDDFHEAPAYAAHGPGRQTQPTSAEADRSLAFLAH